MWFHSVVYSSFEVMRKNVFYMEQNYAVYSQNAHCELYSSHIGVHAADSVMVDFSHGLLMCTVYSSLLDWISMPMIKESPF